jgi:hypothetical protein
MQHPGGSISSTSISTVTCTGTRPRGIQPEKSPLCPSKMSKKRLRTRCGSRRSSCRASFPFGTPGGAGVRSSWPLSPAALRSWRRCSPSSGPRGGRLRWQKNRPRRKSSIAASRSSRRGPPCPTIGAGGRRARRLSRTIPSGPRRRPLRQGPRRRTWPPTAGRPASVWRSPKRTPCPRRQRSFHSRRSAARFVLRNFSARRSPPPFRSTKPNMTRPRSSPLSTRVSNGPGKFRG